MTLTMEVAPETEQRLEEKARRQGLPLTDYVQDLLEREADEAGETLPKSPQPASQPGAEVSPLTAFLALAQQLAPIIRAGTRGPIKAADVIETNREERMRDIAPGS